MSVGELRAIGDGRFALSGEVSLHSVTDLLAQSETLFRRVSVVRLDFKQVTRADSAGLALLVQWMREAQQRNQAIEYANLPQQLRDIADTCGLDRVLPIGKSG